MAPFWLSSWEVDAKGFLCGIVDQTKTHVTLRKRRTIVLLCNLTHPLSHGTMAELVFMQVASWRTCSYVVSGQWAQEFLNGALLEEKELEGRNAARIADQCFCVQQQPSWAASLQYLLLLRYSPASHHEEKEVKSRVCSATALASPRPRSTWQRLILKDDCLAMREAV
jgi:hypothetical protein